MIQKIFLISLFTFVLSAAAGAQTLRMLSMGGISYAIEDETSGLNPYDFAGNPAWFYNDEKVSWLRVIPSNANSWGDYKKLYMPSRINNYNMTFRGVKTLGEDGTFLGETSYLYETRSGVNRSLEYNPYYGSAFFFTDTSSGRFRYDGPMVKFLYGLELLPGLYAGASVNYGILNGLKSIYTRAESHIRDVGGRAGIAYKLSDEFSVAAEYLLSDYQEKIEAKNEDLLDVENYYYRGETFAIKKRSGSVDEKIRRSAGGAGMQVYWNKEGIIEAAASFNYNAAEEIILIPYVKDNESFREFETGKARFYSYNGKAAARFILNENLSLGIQGGYNKRNSWSKNSDKNLSLWDWEINSYSAGLGTAYQNGNLLISAEYDAVISESDSSKYIDSRFTSKESFDNHLRLGAEYKLNDKVYLRVGYNFSNMENDFLFGGYNVIYNKASLGGTIGISDTIILELYTSYGYMKPESGTGERAWFESVASLKLLNF